MKTKDKEEIWKTMKQELQFTNRGKTTPKITISYQKPWTPEGRGTIFLSAERKELSTQNPTFRKKDSPTTRKLQNNIPYKYRFKYPQQNIRKENLVVSKKNYTLWPSWIYSKVQYLKINQCN